MHELSALAVMASISSSAVLKQTMALLCSLMVANNLGLEPGLKKLMRQVRTWPSLPPVIMAFLSKAMAVTPDA